MSTRSAWMWAIVAATSAAASPLVLAGEQPERGRETSKPVEPKPKDAAPPAAAVPAAAPFKNVNELLAALEASGEKINTLECDLMYERRFKLQGDIHTRQGKLFYNSVRSGKPGEPPLRSFAIRFSSLTIDDVRRDQDKEYVFDGQWLVERSAKQKQYIAREVARPGERFDPLRLGEGPMPIPIGQKAAEILARYDAEMLPLGDGIADEPVFLDAATKRSQAQLRLKPRAERAKDDEFKEIRLWYTRDTDGTLLPRLARTVTRSGDISFVLLTAMKKNGTLPPNAIQIEAPPKGDGWDIQYQEGRFKEEGAPKPAPKAPGEKPAPAAAKPGPSAPPPAERDKKKEEVKPDTGRTDPTPY